MYYIGIDIGTSSICGIAYNFETKASITIVRKNTTGLSADNQWEKMQDADRIWMIVKEILLEFQKRCDDIKGIGVTGQMHGILYTDERGEAVSPLYTWQDGRGNLIYKNEENYADYLSRISGYRMATGYGLVTHFYNQCNGNVPAGACKLCTVMDYVTMRLCRRNFPLTDTSNAAGLGLFDKERLCFDVPTCESVGIHKEMLPEVVPSKTLVGYYGDIPVYVAIGDNQAAYLGAVRDLQHSVHLTVGTSSQISVYSERYVEVKGLDTRPFPGGGYLLVGASLCGGVAFAMLKDFFADVLRLFTGQQWNEAELYQKMSSIPYQHDAENSLKVETLFAGTRLQPAKRGKIERISLSNLTAGNLISGFLEGISRELYDFYQLLPDEIRRDKDQLLGSGNGIKKNVLLRNVLEECFGMPLSLSAIQEEASLGACMCVGQLKNNHQKI